MSKTRVDPQDSGLSTERPEASRRPVIVAPAAEPAECIYTAAASQAPRAELRRLRLVRDPRGNLTAGEVGRDVPFPVRRYFLIFGVPGSTLRGEHAHRRCAQFLVAVRGSVCVSADDGTHRQEWTLDQPDAGVYLPPMVWGAQFRYSSDAVLMVLASHLYDAADYIRDYADFLTLVAATKVA